MNRPSPYTAFGDKRAVYQRTLDAYRARAREGLAATLRNDRPLAQSLRDLYELALTLYPSGNQGQCGCYFIGTALTEAVRDAAARDAIAGTLREIEVDPAEQTLSDNTVNLEQQMINLGDVNRDFTMSANIRRAFHQLLLSALK